MTGLQLPAVQREAGRRRGDRRQGGLEPGQHLVVPQAQALARRELLRRELHLSADVGAARRDISESNCLMASDNSEISGRAREPPT